MEQRTIKTGTQFRTLVLEREAIDTEARTVPLAFSSEEPVERYWGVETLDHAPASVRLERLKSRGPLLMDHNPTDQIGVVEDVVIDTDKIGRAVVRFGQGARAQEIYQDVLDGIRGSVSVGYAIHRVVLEEERDGKEFYRAVDWEPLEISLVSVPADIKVGVGRDQDSGDHVTIVECQEKKIETQEETRTMEPKIDTPAPVEPKIDPMKRVNEILEIGEKYNERDLAGQFVRSGKSTEEFVCAILEKRGATPVQQSPEIGLTSKEQRRYSMVRALHALANPTDRQAQEAAAFERECSEAAGKAYRREAQGMLVPYDVMTRDLTVGTAADGGYLKGTDHLAGSFIAALRNRMMTQRLGARVLDGLVGDVAIPKMSAGATAYWVAESGAPTESKQTFAQVALAPKTVGAFTDISRKLLKQSSPSVDMLVEDDLATILALAIDVAALHGSGPSNNQPTGIASTAGIGSVAGGSNGAAPTWANIVSLWSEVAVDNADFGSLGFLTNAKVVGKLMTTEKAANTAQFVCPMFPDTEGMTSFGGMRAGVSNQVSSTLTKGTSSGVASAIFFGNWADLLIGAWGGLDLTVDPYTGSSSGTVRVVALQDVDVAVRNAQSFSAMLDALTA